MATPTTTPEFSSDVERISPEYSKLLAETVDQAGLMRKDLFVGKSEEGVSGLSEQTVWRVLNHKEGPTIVAAQRIRQRIQQLRPDIKLPPPAVAVADADHYEWLYLGTELHEADREEFRKALGLIRTLCDSLRNARNVTETVRRMSKKP